MEGGFIFPVFIISFVLGSVIGSFVNVCIDRLPLQYIDKEKRYQLLSDSRIHPKLKNYIKSERLTLATPARSFCFSCGYQLRWFDNVPILSYLFGNGRCRNCKEPYGIRSVLIEFSHGIVYGVSSLLFGTIWLSWIVSLNFSFFCVLGGVWKEFEKKSVFIISGFVLIVGDIILLGSVYLIK